MKRNLLTSALIAAAMFTVAVTTNASFAAEIKLTSIGPIAFGEDGVLFVSDPMAAEIHAIETGDTKEGGAEKAKFDVEDIKGKIAAMLASTVEQIQISDLAVNPISGNVYLAVSRGKDTIILKVDGESNEISEFELNSKKATKTKLPNPADSKKTRRGNQRMSSITDIAYINGQVYVAGLSNEEFASNLRAIQYPFEKVSPGSSIEIYHGAHGAFETRSPVRTFAAYQIDGETNLLAAYTCTPLVRIPLTAMKEKEKVKGTTIAELGNRNRPLDMVVYKKGGKDFILMANSARGVMKVDLANAGSEEAITTRVSGTAGVSYATIDSLKSVTQLDGLNETHAVVLIEEKGKSMLKSVVLP